MLNKVCLLLPMAVRIIYFMCGNGTGYKLKEKERKQCQNICFGHLF